MAAEKLTNGIFEAWVEEARKEVQSKGWRDASVNAVMLTCHYMSAARDSIMLRAIRGPIRWFVGIIAAGFVWLIIRDILNL